MAVDIKDIEQVANELKGNFDEFRQKMINVLTLSNRKGQAVRNCGDA